MTPAILERFEFFSGVPDSQLQALCDYLIDSYGHDRRRHAIAANEGNAVALAAGYHLATGRTPVVYLQNSGIGNILNPAVSLLHEKVYGIPCLFVIGWRGEPGVHDEPQHIFQGEITLDLLSGLGMETFVVSKDTSEEKLNSVLDRFEILFSRGKCAALVVRKGAFQYEKRPIYKNAHNLTREEAIGIIAAHSGNDPIVSTTGKASRELYELRERNGTGHGHDFLTVGSMGHSSSIAMGIAMQRPDLKVWCLDGDGATIMHMGALATIGASGIDNLAHIVLNNEAHESVGGLPTVADALDLPAIARACGYRNSCSCSTADELEVALAIAKSAAGPVFIEVKCALGSRPDLGRPKSSPQENKRLFMANLRSL